MDKILVVDDIALNCAMLEEMLGDEYEVVTAGNGRIAIHRYWRIITRNLR